MSIRQSDTDDDHSTRKKVMIEELQARIAELEKEVAELKAEIAWSDEHPGYDPR